MGPSVWRFFQQQNKSNQNTPLKNVPPTSTPNKFLVPFGKYCWTFTVTEPVLFLCQSVFTCDVEILVHTVTHTHTHMYVYIYQEDSSSFASLGVKWYEKMKCEAAVINNWENIPWTTNVSKILKLSTNTSSLFSSMLWFKKKKKKKVLMKQHHTISMR